jgi:predicted Ser/Thr protein kinase
MIGQQLGPFLIDKELGAGAMGTVYRGKYLKTGQLVAIKIMAPGTTNPRSIERFRREVEILKQLKHPHIVRILAAGKHNGMPFYAMEYLQGESLDHVMARRDRMSWQEVVDLGLQLCSALQHAHDAGIVHRDLKPSNLMILQDGTLKLTDFGIAKDLDVTQLTEANCTVGTAAYMSPEQCRGERDLTHKSDLYSLGVVFYELITGRKPFQAESAMEMFMLHVNGKFERPSRIVLDLPIWLDTLICQLLEKKPEHRPLDAKMVATVLSSIQEKVEAQQAAGVDVARTNAGDFGEARKLSDPEDRQAARALLGKKSRKKKKAPAPSRLPLLLQAGGLLLLLGLAIAAIVISLQPASADTLHQRGEKEIASIDKLLESDSTTKREQARERLEKLRDGILSEYLRRFGQLNDEKTAQIRRWSDAYDAAFFEELLHKHQRYREGKARIAPEAQTESQKLAFQASDAESAGDAQRAVQLWQQIFDKEGPTGLGVVAARHLVVLKNLDEEDRQLALLHKEVRDRRVEPDKLPPLRELAFLALRQAKLGDLTGAAAKYEQLRNQATVSDSGERFWQVYSAVRNNRIEEDRFWRLYGQVRYQQMQAELDGKPQSEEARINLIRRLISTAQKHLEAGTMPLLDLRLQAQDVLTLYPREPELAEVREQARQICQKVDGVVKR